MWFCYTFEYLTLPVYLEFITVVSTATIFYHTVSTVIGYEPLLRIKNIFHIHEIVMLSRRLCCPDVRLWWCNSQFALLWIYPTHLIQRYRASSRWIIIHRILYSAFQLLSLQWHLDTSSWYSLMQCADCINDEVP